MTKALRRLNFSAVVLMCFFLETTEALKCYQCNSSDTDPKPQCDRLYWKQMSSQERDDLVIDCQKRLSFFCIVIRKQMDNAIITTRGCIGQKDIKGTTLNAGCVDINPKERACLCTDNLCNAAPRNFLLKGHDFRIGMVITTLVRLFLFETRD